MHAADNGASHSTQWGVAGIWTRPFSSLLFSSGVPVFRCSDHPVGHPVSALSGSHSYPIRIYTLLHLLLCNYCNHIYIYILQLYIYNYYIYLYSYTRHYHSAQVFIILELIYAWTTVSIYTYTYLCYCKHIYTYTYLCYSTMYIYIYIQAYSQ